MSQIRAPARLAEPLGQVDRRRPADVVASQALDLGGKGGVGRRDPVALGQLVQRAHDRLGDEPAAEVAETAAFVRLGGGHGASLAARTNARTRS